MPPDSQAEAAAPPQPEAAAPAQPVVRHVLHPAIAFAALLVAVFVILPPGITIGADGAAHGRLDLIFAFVMKAGLIGSIMSAILYSQFEGDRRLLFTWPRLFFAMSTVFGIAIAGSAWVRFGPIDDFFIEQGGLTLAWPATVALFTAGATAVVGPITLGDAKGRIGAWDVWGILGLVFGAVSGVIYWFFF